MTITELIEKLEHIREKYGNIEYCGDQNNIGLIHTQNNNNYEFFLCETTQLTNGNNKLYLNCK